MHSHDSISVCIPVYNVAKYLSACIESILLQTQQPEEIVLMDDASTDQSLAVARRLAGFDKRIKVFSKEHTTLGDTRNRMIRSSSYELIAMLDSDDIAVPDRLAKQMVFMNSHQNCVGVGGQVHFMDEFGHLFYRHPWQPQDAASVERQLLQGRGSTIWQSSLMVRRSAFEKVGGYNASLNCSEDMDLYLKLLDIGELCNLSDVLVLIRRHPQSISALGEQGSNRVRRDRILMPILKKRGINDMPLYELGVEPASKSAWYVRSALGYLDAGSPQVALIHWLCALKENPLNADVWRALARIIQKFVTGKAWVPNGSAQKDERSIRHA